MFHDLAIFAESLTQVLAWPTFGFLLIGMSLGFAVGILPGLGGSTTLALMLPFTFAMDPVTAFAFLLGMGAVTATTGDLTSILFGIPGEPSSAATVLDGYPMTQRGEPGRAIGIVLVSSLMGALLGAFFLAFSIQLLRPLVLRFGPPEFFAVAIVALSFVATLSGRALAKGLVMVCGGILLGTVGQDPGTGRLRLTFNVPYLVEGISIVPVVVGLFAVPAILAMMSSRADTGTAQEAPPVQGWVVGARDALRHKWLIVRCSAIGIFFGMMPGVGGSSSQFIAYAHARQTSKHPEEFGNGSVEGLVAAGSVNNAKEGGDLVPTVGFGVPGSGQMAILLSAFLITGLTPGPAMLTEHLDVTFSMVWTLVVANIITVVLCLIFLKQICSITRVPVHRLVPFLLLFIAIGAYTATNSWNDVLLMLVFGVMAVFAGRWGWPLPPLLLGLVLGEMIERNYFLSYQLADQGYSWLGRPIVLGFLVVLAIGLFGPLFIRALRAVRGRSEPPSQPTTGTSPSRNRRGLGHAAFSAIALVFAIYVIYSMQFADEIPLRTKQFPLLAAVPMAFFAGWQLLTDLITWHTRRPRHAPKAAIHAAPTGLQPGVLPRATAQPTDGQAAVVVMSQPETDQAVSFAEAEASSINLRAVLHFAAFFVCLYALGFVVGVPVYTFLYLSLIARERWWYAALGAGAAYLFLWGLFVQLVPIPLMPSQIFGW